MPWLKNKTEDHKPSLLYTWYKSEGDTVNPHVPLVLFLFSPVPLSLPLSFREGNVHLEFDRLLEDRWTSGGLIFRPETGLRDDTVTERGNLAQRDGDIERWRDAEADVDMGVGILKDKWNEE